MTKEQNIAAEDLRRLKPLVRPSPRREFSLATTISNEDIGLYVFSGSMENNLLDKPILLLDGGLGTTLEDEHGVKFSTATPLWSSHLLVENVGTLETVQRDFADAGADIILTATYQASFEVFKNTKVRGQDGIEGVQATTYMLSAIRIARDAFNGRPGLVALSLGAYGATMIPSTEYSGKYGNMTEQGLYDFHCDRLSSFVDGPEWKEIDLVAFETLPRVDEVRAARRLMQEVHGKPYWISCVFPSEDEKLPDGTSVEELIKSLLEGERPPYGVGINCTKVQKITGLIESFEKAAQANNLELPRLVIYPDGAGGKLYDTTTQKITGLIESFEKAAQANNLELPRLVIYPDGAGGKLYDTTTQKITGLIESFEKAAQANNLELPRLVIYPDGAGGKLYDTTTQKWVGDGKHRAPWDRQVCDIVKEVRVRGNWQGIIVGGCCKTAPKLIKELRERLERL